MCVISKLVLSAWRHLEYWVPKLINYYRAPNTNQRAAQANSYQCSVPMVPPLDPPPIPSTENGPTVDWTRRNSTHCEPPRPPRIGHLQTRGIQAGTTRITKLHCSGCLA